MTWADFYLICFALGFTFSLVSFLAGGLRWHLHLPHFPHGHSAAPVSHGPAPGHAAAGTGKLRTPFSPFNPVSLAAFLTWFGGLGYLLTRFSSLWFVSGLALSVMSGLVGAGIIFLFLSRVLTSDEENLDPADFEMCGVLGRVSVSVRAGGTGEIVYSQAGTRRTCGARAENGSAISQGTEVVVTRYEKGIAYVRRWSEMSGEAAEDGRPEADLPPPGGLS
jgi:membrane protein implicated in regulation of membrane protease activity